MKRIIGSMACLILISALAALPAQGQSNLEREEGFVDFKPIEDLFPDLPRLEVNVKGSLLRLVVEASRHEDPGLAEVLSRLRAVQVRTYDLPSDHKSPILERTDNLVRRLSRSGWETVVRVRETHDHVDLYLRESGDLISGLMLVVIENKQATFVNIVGNIDPAEIALIGRQFNIDPLKRGITGQ